MTLDQFVEFVTDSTGFCVSGATLDESDRKVTIVFDVEVDGVSTVTS